MDIENDPSRRHVTINDLAAAAGVSNATVSRALNGAANVKPEMRERILALAERMNYVPNALARSLRSNATENVTLIVPDITLDYFCRIAKALSQRLRAIGYLTSVVDSGFDLDTETVVVEAAIAARPAALILASVSPEATSRPTYLDRLERSRLPVLLLDRPLGTTRFPLVGLDHRDGVAKCVGLIKDMGWSHVHILSGPDDVYAMRIRIATATTALNDLGIGYALDWGELDDRAAAQHTAAILERNPDARFFALNSALALGAIAALTMAGQPPHDRLVTFDAVPLAQTYGHRLACVEFSCDLIADAVAEILAPTLTTGTPLPARICAITGEARSATPI